MIISLTFKLYKPLNGEMLAILLNRLITLGWVLYPHIKAYPLTVGYLRSNSVTGDSYDINISTADIDALINELPRDFRFISVQMLAHWIEGSLSVSLVVDNLGLTIGFDCNHELLLNEEQPDKEKANLRQFIGLVEPLLIQLGPSPGAIGVDADINSEVINLDWRFWPCDLVKQADPLALEVARETAYLCYDFHQLGIFIAMTPLLHFDYDLDYKRRMGILERVFGKTQRNKN